jgi:beta-mannosidase
MLPPRSSVQLSVEALLGAFADTTYAYRFGPPSHDVVVARLSDVTTRSRLADAVYFPERPPIARRRDLCIEAGLVTHQDDALLELRANAFAYAVHVEADGFEATDDYFHLEPDVVRQVALRTLPRMERSIRISALNGAGVVLLRASGETAQSA